MKILAVIPARGGSKRVPGKNLRKLGNKPLINWTIDNAQITPDLFEILVSTDDPAIAEIAKSSGVMVPWLRPKELATDAASSVDVTLHALDWYEKEKGAVDGVLLLQPTSPFRTQETIQYAINLFRKNRDCTIIGVSPVRDHSINIFVKQGKFLIPFSRQNNLKSESEDKPDLYSINGCIYLISPTNLRTKYSFIGSDFLPVVINSSIEALDIDTESDFKLAETVTKMLS
jgi:N-acylneuraminate cytidylyltransferase